MGDDTACFPGCACLRCVGVVKPGTEVAVPNQAVHLGADGVCIHGQSETCDEGFRRLGLDRKTPWVALPASESDYAAGDVISRTDGGHQDFWIVVDMASGPDKTAYLSYGRKPLERSGRPWLELVSEGEQQAVRQRERARVENQVLGKLYCEATERNVYLEAVVGNMPTADSVKEMLDGKDAEIALLHQALAMKDARIGELKSVLASTPVAFEDPDAKPEPEINPFRNFGHDPRRMGPL